MDADDYLTIPVDYAWALGGLRWSPEYDAIESDEGGTLTVVQHLDLILEGLFSAGPTVPHFAHVLHLLRWILHSTSGVGVEAQKLHLVFRHAQGPGVSRNVGILIAALCRSLPHVAAPPAFGAVRLCLKRRLLFRDPSDSRRAERPALGPAEFERRILGVLSEYDIDTLAHWLRHGCAPAPATGRRLAASVAELPTHAVSLVAALRRRPRLAGAVALASTLEAALALPPRRLRPDARPEGGYAGVTTRGDPERLLLSQFALDSQDFVRRFAEHELLYFRREEPHRRERPTRLIVFDQGVRTWGGVRLALAGAVIVLLGKDRRRHGAPRLALAARPPFDPAELPTEELACLLEASDLSPHPAACLSAALAEPEDGPRDVVLLTHPRNLREPAVVEAARQGRTGDRLFALAVDGDGRAALAEWRGRGFVELRAFRVDLAGAEALHEPVQEAPRATAGAITPWTGDVESVAYPFRPGVLDTPQRLAFDAAGEWLALSGPDGLLQVARIGESAAEVLPRPSRAGVALTTIDALLGVAGGFVVGGRTRVRLPAAPLRPGSTKSVGKLIDIFVLAHYDLGRRHVTLYTVAPMNGPTAHWRAFADLNSVVAFGKDWGCAIDLATGQRFGGQEWQSADRAREALERASWPCPQPPTIPVVPLGSKPGDFRGPWVKMSGGVVWLGGINPPWPPFIPTADGRPLLNNVPLAAVAQLGGQTLALRTRPERGRPRLILFRGPGGRLIREFDLENADRLSELSADGRRLAWQTGRRAVEVTGTDDVWRPVLSLTRAAVHPDLRVRLDERALTINVGRFVHTFSLNAVPLQYRLQNGGPHVAATTVIVSAGPSEPVPGVVARDPQRFRVAAVWGTTIAVLDRWGQVILIDRHDRTVAHFLVRRGSAAVCLPDGTRWGAVALLGLPETPGAAEAVGHALAAMGKE